MEPFLKKYARLIHLAFVVIFAGLLGFALTEYLAVALAPFTVPEVETAKASDKPSKKPAVTITAQSFKKGIADRCLFGCSDAAEVPACPDGCADGEVCQNGACVKVEAEVPQNSELAVQSDLAVKLMGSMVARTPEHSLALVAESSSKTTFIVGIGDRLMNEAEVVEIRRDRIIFRRNARLEYVRIEASIMGAPSIRPKVSNSAPSNDEKDVKRPVVPAIAQNSKPPIDVKKLAQNKFEIDRAALNEQLSDPEKLAKAARIVPVYDKNGKSNGIKLINVSDSSVYKQIGIQTGDVVMAINGQKIDSQAKALQLLDSMKNASKVSIEVERQGRKETMEYSVK